MARHLKNLYFKLPYILLTAIFIGIAMMAVGDPPPPPPLHVCTCGTETNRHAVHQGPCLQKIGNVPELGGRFHALTESR